MPIRLVKAPVSLLLDPNLPAAAKVLWLALDSAKTASGSKLAAASGLTLATIRKAKSQLEAGGWYSPATGAAVPSPGRTVSIPVSLLQSWLRPGPKLLYGILQATPGFRNDSGQFTYATLSHFAGLSTVTARKSIGELAQAGWIEIDQKHQLVPVRFRLRIPELDQGRAEVAQAERRLKEADFRGEAIMKEYLSLLIDSDEFEDNARPGFLVNPQTEERLELDRYYPPAAAFEFHGLQHFRTTARFPNQLALAKRQARDLIKEALCARRGIRLVVITPADLNLEAMKQKVGTLLPQGDLSGREELIDFLEKVSRSYRE